ncbi:hypothetical protein E9840_10625 [Tissierella creatinini]|nr:hypothetical protein E9840_10625 [Tissierella creatinini]TJX61928.1 hypothetical protein E8P77_17720 [Soehngenia saccharolytica]
MKERAKTILLFLLVFSSVYMTSKLWIKLPDKLGNFFKSNEVLSASYELSDMISPSKYLLNFGNKNHTITYDDSKYDIWVNSKILLSSVLEDEFISVDEITKDQYLNFQEERSIVFYFPEELNTYILAKTWDVKSPNKVADAIPNIVEIYMYLGNGNPFFVFSDENRYVLVKGENIDNSQLKDELTQIDEAKLYDYYYSMREIYGIENDIYIPYNTDYRLSTIHFSNELVNQDDNEKRQLAVRFFNKNIDYIREIVESNGSTIYVLNKRVLKLNSNGTLDYFQALEETIEERNLYTSLITAADFITHKTSSQKSIYLSNIETIQSDNSKGYRLSFKYRIRGIPVLLGNREIGDYIQIEVFNNHIRSYKQLTRTEDDMGLSTRLESRSMMSSIDILDNNYDFLEKEYLTQMNKTKEEVGDNITQEVLGLVDDINLAYYDPNLKDQGERLIGVWAVRFNNRIYAFNAYTGNLVFER